MRDPRSPSEALQAGRRELEGLPGVHLLEDYAWSEPVQKWVLRCRLHAEVAPDGPVPAASEWYVLVGDEYPWGSIGFYPAKEGGLEGTFPHQDYNAPGTGAESWRRGKLCLDTTVKALGLHGQSDEPAAADYRLAWHFRRALAWLDLASRGELLAPGDPFELPQFPMGDPFETVSFVEGPTEYIAWQGIRDQNGLIEYAYLNRRPATLVVRSFLSASKRPLLARAWGEVISRGLGSSYLGAWVRLPQLPVLPPWQAPATWGELRQACAELAIDLDALLERAVRRTRDGGQHLALIGWPIPARVGEAPAQMHWQALRLPVLSHGPASANGFRPHQGGYARRDRQEVLRDEVRLQWARSENWHPDQLATRGRLPNELTERRALLIGAGALGSALAEMLVRAGVHDLVVMDGEVLAAGNLVRHTLGLHETLRPKASALAQHLNLVSPHANVRAFDEAFPPREGPARDATDACDVIIDCTGDEEVPVHLSQVSGGAPRHFFSLSLGLYAQRLYFFAACSERFPQDAFRAALAPWLREDRTRYDAGQLPWEGVGCWHPVFPARVDDVWLLAATAVKLLGQKMIALPAESELVVLEQAMDEGGFAGVRVAEMRTARE